MRVHENVVVIKTATKYHRIPLGNLNVEDQEHVYFRRLNRKGQDRVLREILSRDERTWKTQEGREIIGRFYRVVNGHVSIRSGRDFRAVAYSELVADDRDYVRQTLRELGLDQQLPDGHVFPDYPAIRPATSTDGSPDERSHTDSQHPSSGQELARDDAEEIGEQQFYDRFMPGRNTGNVKPNGSSVRRSPDRQKQAESTIDVVDAAGEERDQPSTAQQVSNDFNGYVRSHGGLVLFLIVIGVIVVVLVKLAMK